MPGTGLAAALLASAALLGCGAPALPDSAATSSFACEGLASTLLAVDPTRTSLAERFGPPDSARVRTERNRHVPDRTDSIFTLHYPGLVAEIRVAGGRDLTTTSRSATTVISPPVRRGSGTAHRR